MYIKSLGNSQKAVKKNPNTTKYNLLNLCFYMHPNKHTFQIRPDVIRPDKVQELQSPAVDPVYSSKGLAVLNGF